MADRLNAEEEEHSAYTAFWEGASLSISSVGIACHAVKRKSQTPVWWCEAYAEVVVNLRTPVLHAGMASMSHSVHAACGRPDQMLLPSITACH